MKTVLLFFLLTLLTFVSEMYSQNSGRAILAGTWAGGEDSSEFVYHKIEEFALSYLPDNPDGKIVARICSTSRMPAALANSSAVVKELPHQASHFRISAERVFFARSSKCKTGHEQYWYVPGPIGIEYDELVLSQKVRIEQWAIDDNEKVLSSQVKNEFLQNVREFVAAMKNGSTTEGFLFQNRRTQRYQIRAVQRQLKSEGVDSRRFRIFEQTQGDSYYPRLEIVSVN